MKLLQSTRMFSFVLQNKILQLNLTQDFSNIWQDGALLWVFEFDESQMFAHQTDKSQFFSLRN